MKTNKRTYAITIAIMVVCLLLPSILAIDKGHNKNVEQYKKSHI